jgi:flagellar biosynthetic protein FliR
VYLQLQPLIDSLAIYVWPFLRISAFVMAMPALGGAFVPRRIRALLAIVLTLVVAPLATSRLEPMEIFTFAGLLRAMQEVAIGATMGFVVQIIFDAVTLGGQTIAMSMGLGFAVFLDRARGVNMPVISQFFMMLVTLIFLAIDGHLVLIRVLTESFTTTPIGTGGFGRVAAGQLLEWSATMFIGAIQIALPAITALLIVNLSFGVMSRAAPTLNLFAIGFPISMLLGFVVIYVGLGGLERSFLALFPSALETLATMFGTRSP